MQIGPSDAEKTVFIIDRKIFCYRVMPFCLKNERTACKRLVNKIFTKQILKNMEVYVDDMVTKSIEAKRHPTDLQ